MTQPPNDNNDLRPRLDDLGSEFGQRRSADQATPEVGEAQPIPQQQTFRLQLPFGQARIFWVLLALNIGIFVIPTVLQILGVRFNGIPVNDFLLLLGQKDNAAIRSGEYYRFLTSMFLHVGIFHIGFNAWALYALGPQAERIYGTGRFLALYFLAGLAGGVASYMFSPDPAVGASGAIFGLVGALAAFFYLARRVLGEVSRQQLGSLITVIMINMFIGFSSGGRIDNFAHIGGLIGGALVGWLLAPRLEIDQRLYPPQITRRNLPGGWAGALAVLALLVFLILTIQPPIQ